MYTSSSIQKHICNSNDVVFFTDIRERKKEPHMVARVIGVDICQAHTISFIVLVAFVGIKKAVEGSSQPSASLCTQHARKASTF